MHFAEITAEAHDIGDALHLTQNAADSPLKFGARFIEVVPVAGDAKLVNFAEGRGLGRQSGNDAIGQIRTGQPLGDEQAGLEAVGIVVESEGDQ